MAALTRRVAVVARRPAGIRALLLGLVLLGSACSGDEQTGWNVVLVVVDTLRADHLTPYHYERDTSPHLARLAERGVVFEQVVAQFHETRPSHVSLMTGLYPMVHGVVGNFGSPCPPQVRTLAEVLEDAGYATGAVIGNFLLRRDFRLDQGFDTYDDEMTSREKNRPHFGEKTAGAAIGPTLRWLDEHADQRFFWLHLQDPHGPYLPPAPWRERYADDDRLRTGLRLSLDQIPLYQRVEGVLDHDDYVARYDAEIAYTDDAVGKVLDKLDELGVAERTLVVFTADHGESLGERGLYYLHHMPDVYEEIVRVPLVVAGPGVVGGRRSKALVELVDVMPTLLELLGIPAPPEIQGRSFTEPLRGSDETPDSGEARGFEDLAFAQGREGLIAVQGPRFKLVAHEVGDRLFDLEQDPGELRSVLRERPEVTRRLRRALTWRHQQDTELRERLGVAAEWTPEQREEDLKILRALGYTDDGTR